jgi:glycosyltransferase involved in cell wall biosynthesis
MISVLLSVYNGDKFLAKAIDSVLCQEFYNFEFIIVNDGSTDQSQKIIDYYAKKDERIKSISISNSGLANGLNHGLKFCKFDIIARIDADDIWLPNKLNIQYAHFKKNNLDLCCTGFYVNDPDKALKKYFPTFFCSKGLLKSLWRLNPGVAHSSLMYNKNMMYENSRYRAFFKTAEDFDLLILFAKYYRCGSVREPLVVINKFDDSISAKIGAVGQKLDAIMALGYSEELFAIPESALNSNRSIKSVELRKKIHLKIMQHQLGKTLKNKYINKQRSIFSLKRVIAELSFLYFRIRLKHKIFGIFR